MGNRARNRLAHIERAQLRLETMSEALAKASKDEVSADDWIILRAELGVHTAGFNDSLLAIDRLYKTGGSQAKILRFLQLRLGVKVAKEELRGVAGVHEWARRVRELRQDFGWDIQSATTCTDLNPGEYILRQSHPDPDLAANWTSAREMGKMRTAGGRATPKIRTLEFLKDIFPRCGDSEQLVHVAGSKEKSTSSLASLVEDGWLIVSCGDDMGAIVSARLQSLERP